MNQIRNKTLATCGRSVRLNGEKSAQLAKLLKSNASAQPISTRQKSSRARCRKARLALMMPPKYSHLVFPLFLFTSTNLGNLSHYNEYVSGQTSPQYRNSNFFFALLALLVAASLRLRLLDADVSTAALDTLWQPSSLNNKRK